METKAELSSRAIQFYVVSVKWASDLNFFKIETAFFHRLVDEHFKNMVPERIAQLRADTEKLRTLDTEIHKAETKLGLQLRLIELMAEDIIPEDVDSLAGEQVQLENLMAEIVSHFREVKKELFSMVEGVFKSTGQTVS